MQSSFPRQQEQGRGQEPPQAQQQHQQLEKSSNSTHITTHKPIHPTFAFPQTLSNSEDAMACTCPMDFFLCYMTLHRSMYEPVPTLHDPNHVHPAHPDAHQAALNLLEKDLEKFFQSTLECGKVLVDKAGVLLNCPRCRGPAHIHSSDNASPSPGGLFPNIPGAPVDPFVGMSAMAMLGNPSSTSTGKGTTAPPPGPWGIGGGPNTLLIGALLPLTIQLYEKVLRAIISPPPPPFSFENIPQCPSSSSSPLPLWRVPAIKALLAEMDKIEMLAREMIRCTRERHVAAHEAGYPRVSFGRGGGPRCKVKANKGASINGKGNATAAAAVEESVSGSGASTGQEYRNPGSASASVMDLDSDSDHNPDSNSKDPASNEEEKEEEEEEEEEDPICLRVVKGMADQIFWRAGYVNELMRGVEGLGIKCGSREEG